MGKKDGAEARRRGVKREHILLIFNML
jgi:hypothetical protein